MKVFVMGASGRVGQQVVHALVDAGHSVLAGARNTDSIAESNTVKAVNVDLHQQAGELAKVLAGCDAVIFTAGSRGKDLLRTDLYGAVKTMQAAEACGIRRFVHLSTILSLQPDIWEQMMPDNMMNYYIAKYFSDLWLTEKATLDYTIIQPVSLTEEPGSGKVSFQPDASSSNSIENVAQVLTGVLESKNTYGKIITMSDGDTPIKEAIDDYN